VASWDRLVLENPAAIPIPEPGSTVDLLSGLKCDARVVTNDNLLHTEMMFNPLHDAVPDTWQSPLYWGELKFENIKNLVLSVKNCTYTLWHRHSFQRCVLQQQQSIPLVQKLCLHLVPSIVPVTLEQWTSCTQIRVSTDTLPGPVEF
jgi:hypothetical protein